MNADYSAESIVALMLLLDSDAPTMEELFPNRYPERTDMYRVYYHAQNCKQPGKVAYAGYEKTPPLESVDLLYVEAETPEQLAEILRDDIRIWSRQPFNSERMWQIRWRESVIDYIGASESSHQIEEPNETDDRACCRRCGLLVDDAEYTDNGGFCDECYEIGY